MYLWLSMSDLTSQQCINKCSLNQVVHIQSRQVKLWNIQSLMPYYSIAEWRARIGSSWCALGRPFKIKSTLKHGARVIKKELTLNRVVTMMILMIMLVGVNIAVRGLVTVGHHHQLISQWAWKNNVMALYSVALCIFIIDWLADLLCLLHQRVLTLTSALIFTSILKILSDHRLKHFQWHPVICGSYNTPLSVSLLLYVLFLIVKMMYPAKNLIPWLASAGTL